MNGNRKGDSMFFPSPYVIAAFTFPIHKRVTACQRKRAIVTGCFICCNYIFHCRIDGVSEKIKGTNEMLRLFHMNSIHINMVAILFSRPLNKNKNSNSHYGICNSVELFP